jgi:hypothetical protein
LSLNAEPMYLGLGGLSTMHNSIVTFIFGALILIAAFAPIVFVIFDKAGL